MGDWSLDLVRATVYAMAGCALSLAYRVSPRLREEPIFHGLTVFITLACLALVVAGENGAPPTNLPHAGTRFLLFFGASLFYVPAIVFVALRYWELALERILSASSRRNPPPRFPLSEKEQWKLVQSCLKALSSDPTNARIREQLADIYARLGFFDSAAYEYQKAAQWLERGYAQSLLLYKAAHTIVERRKRPEAALPLLRKIILLYPKSYFAAYARRVLNAYEARSGSELDVRT